LRFVEGRLDLHGALVEHAGQCLPDLRPGEGEENQAADIDPEMRVGEHAGFMFHQARSLRAASTAVEAAAASTPTPVSLSAIPAAMSVAMTRTWARASLCEALILASAASVCWPRRWANSASRFA